MLIINVLSVLWHHVSLFYSIITECEWVLMRQQWQFSRSIKFPVELFMTGAQWDVNLMSTKLINCEWSWSKVWGLEITYLLGFLVSVQAENVEVFLDPINWKTNLVRFVLSADTKSPSLLLWRRLDTSIFPMG